jgi:hypothetical protein
MLDGTAHQIANGIQLVSKNLLVNYEPTRTNIKDPINDGNNI